MQPRPMTGGTSLVSQPRSLMDPRLGCPWAAWAQNIMSGARPMAHWQSIKQLVAYFFYLQTLIHPPVIILEI